MTGDTMNNAILSQQFTYRLFENKESNLTELVVTVLFAILISEALALFLYRIISTYTQNHFYSTFTSYTAFLNEMIDDNEGASFPRSTVMGMSRSGSQLSLDERKLLMDNILTTRLFDKKHVPGANLMKIRNILQRKDDNEDDSDAFQCAICLVELEHNDSVSHPKSCNHEYHTDCLHQWLHKHDTCPTCRRNVFM
eukprot:63472_1